MSENNPTVAVIGAGGKMGMRVSDNLQQHEIPADYSENSEAGMTRVQDAGREITETDVAVRRADIIILAVPDLALGQVSAQVVPQMRAGATLLTLDPAAAYANLLTTRNDVARAVAHPCHPSVFLERYTDAEHADTFGGVAAPQEVVAAIENNDDEQRQAAEKLITVIYAPVIEVHWITVKQLAYLEPTLVESVMCMVGSLLQEALDETVNTAGVPEEAARAMLFGHAQIALTNALRSSNPFSDACLIAMDYGREKIVRPDWKSIFDDRELDHVIGRMLHLNQQG